MSLPKPKESILSIAPYVGGKSTAAPGVRVVKLSSNETPLGASPLAKKTYAEVADKLHRYPDGSANALREAIAEVYKLPVEKLICGNGSDELIGLLVQAYTNPGDEVLYSEHGFLMYKIYAQSAGAVPVTAPEKNLRTDVDALLKAVTAKTKIVFVANPNNPTGSYVTGAELKKLRDGLPAHVILAVDGAYAEYPEVPDYSSGQELAATTDNTIMLRTFSKIYGLSGLRVGWGFAAPSLLDALNRIRSPFNVSSVGIAVAAAAVRDVAFTEKTRQFNNSQLAATMSAISALGLKVHPSIANFYLVEFPAGKHSAAAATSFLAERGLIARDVVGYGLPNCVRISVGLEEDNQAVVATLKEFLGS